VDTPAFMEEDTFASSFVQGDDNAMLAAIKARDSSIAPLLRTDPVRALHLSLADPPYQTKTQAVKDASCDVVCKALLAIKDADVEPAVAALSLDQCDVLMKYIYSGLGQTKKDKQYQPLLKWHGLVLKRAGQASIVRVISEVQRVV